MAKTRAQSAKLKSAPKVKQQSFKKKIRSEKGGKNDVEETKKLMKLCRPFSILLTRIKESSSAEKSKFIRHFIRIFFI